MPETLVLVHTIPLLVDAFSRWCADLLPGVRVLHILDQPMLERINERGATTAEDEERLAGHIALAEAIGADAVLVTCSTVSLCVDAVRGRFDVPVVKIDEAMAAEAVRLGNRIAVVATAQTTLAPSRALLLAEAARHGRPIEVTTRLVDAALPALLAGDAATHDRLVDAAVREEADRSDVVVLAQATMARVLDVIAGRPTPVAVLSSPHLALADVERILAAARPADPKPNQPPHPEVRR
jgi:aspartate/glutamate racemase